MRTRRKDPSARYEEIESCVRAFQQGDREAGLRILEAMQPYLLKYVRLVRQGHVNWSDYDSRRFLSLLIPEANLRKAILRRYQTTTTQAKALHYLRILVSAIRPIPQEDLEQEMAAILLGLARRYKPMPHRNFVGYVAGRRGAFKYALLRSLKAMVADPSVFQAFTGGSVPFDERLHATIYDDPANASEGQLSHEWVRGETAGFPFDRLSPEQRMALRMRYEQGMSEQEVAYAMGLSLTELRSLVRNARRTLEASLGRALPPEDSSEATPQAPPPRTPYLDQGVPDVPDPTKPL